jgi:hypothetical protein
MLLLISNGQEERGLHGCPGAHRTRVQHHLFHVALIPVKPHGQMCRQKAYHATY